MPPRLPVRQVSDNGQKWAFRRDRIHQSLIAGLGYTTYSTTSKGAWQMSIELSINGETLNLEVDPQMPLLWAIRDHAGMTGTKFGCGKALCGTCTVHLDGQPVRSCILPVASAAGREVTTIEGLSNDGNHPVQVAWRELNVPQCGFCQTGQIMSAAALLANNPSPSDADIDAAMSGNICRCGTYTRIRAAIHLAAEEST
jgi:isoquinoline 1-oxidoreductase alpha subunit